MVLKMKITPIEKDTYFLRRTISDLNEQIDLLAMLQDISRQIISRFDFNQIIDMFLDIVKEIINYRLCILYLYQEDTKTYTAVRLKGIAKKDLPQYEPDKKIINWVLKEGRWTHILSRSGNKDFLSILPLQGAQKSLGFLLMAMAQEKNVFNQANMKLLSFVASQTSIALENQELYARLQHSREYIENILESINNGIITINMTDRITQINKNATAMLGLPSADIIGVNYKDALAKDIVKIIDKIKRRTLKDGFAFESMFEYAPVKNLKIPLAISSSQLLGEQTKCIGIIIVLRDMSASKEIERLRQLDELKSEFVSSVSHELRTPLSIIKSYVEAILNQVSPTDYETQREFLHVVNNETDRMSGLVGDLLDIARIESGKFELELAPVMLSEIVRLVLKTLEGRSSEHQIVTHIPATLPRLSADRDKMVRVLFNLLDNAIKFSPDGGKVNITASVKGKMITCTISDQGLGIAKKDIPYIFDKFYRVENPETSEISGTGLGLPIVRHIIEAHGGKISVKSTPGKRTTFTLQLPVIKN